MKYLAIFIPFLRLVSHFINIIAIVESHGGANEISKCGSITSIMHTRKRCAGRFEYLRELVHVCL